MRSVVAYNSGEYLTTIPRGTDSPELYMQRLVFLEYMSDSTNDRSTDGLKTLATILQVPHNQLVKWKKSPSFQTLLAKRTRDKALGGMGLALAYEELMKIVSSPKIDVKIRQKAATDLAKLSLKQDEMYLRYKLAKDKNREHTTKKTFEQEILEAEYEILSEEEAG